jgi:hypothetical protein
MKTLNCGSGVTKKFKHWLLDYEHMIKARAHKGGVRIGKTPKK